MATAPSEQEAAWIDDRTKPPFLRRVHIQGYKSIAYCDVPLQPLTVLVGRNAAGKSNFLDALAFLRDLMEIHVTQAVNRRGGWRSVVCRTADAQRIEIEVEAVFTCGRPYQMVSHKGLPSSAPVGEWALPDLEGVSFTANYKVELSLDTLSIPTIAAESLEMADATGKRSGRFTVKRPHGSHQDLNTFADVLPYFAQLRALSHDRPLLSLIGTQPFIDLAEGLRGMGFYNFNPDAMRPLQKPLPGALLERDGRNLASVIEGLKEIDPDAVQRLRDYLSLIAEEIEDFDVVRYGEYETVRFRVRSTGSGLEFDAANMSDGTLRALAALVAGFQIHLPTGPSVIGIEEAETSLHPAAMRALLGALEEATGHTQILLTAHSGDLLSERELDASQILVVRNRNGQTQIAPVDPASREILRKELYTLADLQRMDQLAPDEADLERQARAKATDGEA